MHLDQIVSLITKVAAEHPEARQDIIDIGTLAYRDGLIQGKLNEIAELEDMDPSEIDEGDITPGEMQQIIDTTESWFRGVMAMNARRMVQSHDEEEREAGEQYLREAPPLTPRPLRKGSGDHDLQQDMQFQYIHQVKNIIQSIMGDADLTNFKPTPARATNRVQIHLDELSKENPGLFD
jgi:(2Fe-2S) ferredoxin